MFLGWAYWCLNWHFGIRQLSLNLHRSATWWRNLHPYFSNGQILLFLKKWHFLKDFWFLLWLSTCFLNLSFSTNFISHISHDNDLSCWWLISKCFSNRWHLLNESPHTSHLYCLFLPCSLLVWFLRLILPLKLPSPKLQSNSLEAFLLFTLVTGSFIPFSSIQNFQLTPLGGQL